MLFENTLFDMFDRLELEYRFFRNRKILLKFYKRNNLNSKEVFHRSYLKSLEELKISLLERNAKKKGTEQKNANKSIIDSLLFERLNIMNKEFMTSLKNNMFLSIDSLVRQIIELYGVALFTQISPDFNKSLLGIQKKDTPFLLIIKTLKDKKIIPKGFDLSNIKLEDYFDGVYTDFRIFSTHYHTKQDIFLNRAFKIVKEEKIIQTIPFREDPNLNEGDKVIVFTNYDPYNHRHLGYALNKFFSYQSLVIRELLQTDQFSRMKVILKKF